VVIPIPREYLLSTRQTDSDGTPELYVTILDRELSSRVYLPTESGLVLRIIALVFRGIGSNLKNRIINVRNGQMENITTAF
jgi:hypothetical protein